MNSVVHFELPYEDRDRMSEFYTKAFGWKTKNLGPEMGDYVTVETGPTDSNRMLTKPGMINGGLYKKDASKGATLPSLVLGTGDIKETMEKIQQAGGKVLGEPMQIPGVGLFVAFMDTEGNTNSVIQPNNMEYSEKISS